MKTVRTIWTTVFVTNTLDAYVPEVWAQESLMVLENNMVMANLVHRDFQNEIQQFGDTVNTRRPGKFTAGRKVDGDTIVEEAATASNVAIVLNQHVYKSFIIYDGEESKGFKSLVTEFLEPAVVSIARIVDQIIMGQMWQFRANAVGKLGTTPTIGSVIGIGTDLDKRATPPGGRNFVFGANIKDSLLNIANFTDAEKVGDDGTAMREGSLGRKFGLDNIFTQNAPTIAAPDVVTGAVNNGAGYAAGTTDITVDGFAAAIANGSWCTIAGDMRPRRIEDTTGSGTPTRIDLVAADALDAAVVDNAVVTIIDPGAINAGSGYAADWSKAMTVDALTIAPQTGQLASFTNATGAVHGLVGSPTTTSILADRPLEAAAADDAPVFLGPAGDYGFAFHKNSIAFVSRPLALPPAGTGARGFVASFNGLSIRVVISYDSAVQGTRVTVDVLCGVKVLDTDLGTVFYA